MMKKFVKNILILIFFLASFWVLFPKVNAYYLLEKELLKHQVIVNDEKLNENGLYFYVNDANILYNELELATIKQSSWMMTYVYNEIRFSNIVIDKSFQNFVPGKIDEGKISFALWDPLNVNVHFQGEFGEAYGHLNLMSKKMVLKLKPKKGMKKYQGMLSSLKQVNGEYVYEHQL